MWHPRWLLTLPLALAATLGTANASSIRDDAKMFSADAVQKAEAVLDRVEREDKVPVIIETIPTLNGEEIADVSLERARRASSRGVYILFAKEEHKLYERVSRSLSRAITPARQRSIRTAFLGGLKQGDADAALLQGVKTIASEVASAHAEVGTIGQAAPQPFPGRAGVPVRRQRGFGLSSLLGIGLLVVGVLFLVRLLGTLFGGGRQAMGGQPNRFGGGYGPGYGGGGGGGGFMSGLFGGIGGALAGNWLYDQFSGRHHGGYSDSSSMGGDPGASSTGDDWTGGTGGGGDWGGGDAGGGGDWGGGGGGDFGGGGGGGGDW